MSSKRLRVARSLMAVGAYRLAAMPAASSLLVLNYHRLHASAECRTSRFDDGVFDTDVDTFRRQMEWLKAATTVLDEEGLLNLAQRKEVARGKIFSAVTFDDGYRDCFTLARPVLEGLGLRGIFFLPFEMLEQRRLGWWDVAAYLLKSTQRKAIALGGETYDLTGGIGVALRRVLAAFKLEPAERTGALLSELADSCGVAPPSVDQQDAELMTWDQVKAMHGAGHGIGSHTMSHRVLATLDPGVQEVEIVESKRRLEAALGRTIQSFAYPVGGRQHINAHSVRLVQEAGYEQAFTFLTGLSSLPLADRFQIPRESAVSLDILKAKTLLPRVMGLEVARSATV